MNRLSKEHEILLNQLEQQWKTRYELEIAQEKHRTRKVTLLYFAFLTSGMTVSLIITLIARLLGRL